MTCLSFQSSNLHRGKIPAWLLTTSTMSYQQSSCSSLQLGARCLSASKCLTSSPSVKIETRFYPFMLISGRIVNAHTKSDTDLKKYFCETCLHNDKGLPLKSKASSLHLPLPSLFAFCHSCCKSLSFTSSPVCWRTLVDSIYSLVQYLFHSSISST